MKIVCCMYLLNNQENHIMLFISISAIIITYL